MGVCISTQKGGFNYQVFVKTGDRLGEETCGDVSIAFYNVDGYRSRFFELDNLFSVDFRTGKLDEFNVHIDEPGFAHPVYIEVRRESPLIVDDTWFCEYIKVRCVETQRVFMFPLHRWVPLGVSLKLKEFDMVLPQDDELIFQRRNELQRRKEIYDAVRHEPTTLLLCEKLPKLERFPLDEVLDLGAAAAEIAVRTQVIKITTDRFKKLEEIENIYSPPDLPVPRGMKLWKSDKEFGYNRLAGCNPTQIRLCTDIPANFAVSESDLKPLIEDLTLKDALQQNKLFIINYEFLRDLKCTDDRKVCAPKALFFVNKEKHLMPVAIQLLPDAAPDNPVFYPSDPEYTWLMAKCYFNNADASIHQSLTHLGFTHLIGEGIAIATNRCMSLSHPVHRILAPHFLYLLAINNLAVQKLIVKGGWVDESMTIGRIGMFEIIKRKWATWRLDVEGNLLADLKDRGVDDPEVLPNYHYRDDAVLLRKAIFDYVKRIVDAHYDSEEKVANDTELQKWGHFLAGDPGNEKELALGMKGLPNGGNFQTADQITETVTNFIFICSAGHAAANFGQYDQYGFPPNYPAMLHGEPPKNKDPLSEQDIINQLPNVKQTLSAMLFTKILSTRGTKPLGDFEIQYIYHPPGVASQKRFQADLTDITAIIDDRNEKREVPYIYLNPREVPNAISI